MCDKQDETKPVPFVRVIGIGCDVTISIDSVDDLDIAKDAIDLAFKRYKKENAPTTVSAGT